MFAGVQNSIMIKWNVIDAQDFPNIWHVWLRIGEYYYDPTFDDPIWTNNTKTSHNINTINYLMT